MTSAKADNNREAWTYTDDQGTDWRVSSKTVYTSDGTDGAKYGGEQAASTVPHLPKGWRMRAVKCTSSGQPDRWIVCYDTVCALWATPGTTVVRDVNGVDQTYTSTNRVRSEKQPSWYGGITQAS